METERKKYIITYFLSFSIPVIFFAVAYFQLGIYPGGTSTVLIYDMRAQLLAFYGYLSNFGPGFDGFFHNMSGGLGGGFFGTFALYISPFDLIYCIVPQKYIPDAIYVMTLLKIGFSGLFFSIFASKYKKFSLNTVFIVLISCCYALMTYNFMYSMSPMWLDLVMFLPLLALFLEKIIKGKLSYSFIILLAFCIICDYYIAYMVVLAISMYFVFRLIENGDDFKESIKRIGLFALHGLISAGISAIVTLPVIMDFRRGKLSEVRSDSQIELIKNSLLEVFSSLKASSYSTLEGGSPPNVFCGTVIELLALLWLFWGRKNLKTRISGAIIVVIYLCSFVFGPVDRVWHGFRDPVGFSARYSFTFVFFVICFAIRGFECLSKELKESTKNIFGLIGALCVLYTFAEMYINGAYVFSRLAVEARFSPRSEYSRICDVMSELLSLAEQNSPEEYSRLFKNFRYSRFDGAFFGYDGLERFSSSYNYNTNVFLSDLGLGTSYHTLGEFGMTPPVSSFLSMGYFISYYKDCSLYYDFVYENKGIELYKNQYKLPLAFNIDTPDKDDLLEFGDIPFENINILYSDLVSSNNESPKIFLRQEYECSTREPDHMHSEYSLESVDYYFTVHKGGSYWLYSDYVETDDARYMEAWRDGRFSEIPAFANYYLNDKLLGAYRNDEFCYCDEIGYLNENEEYVLNLESTISNIGNTYIYFYDDDVFKTLSRQISQNAYSITRIDSKGIELIGTSYGDSSILVSLPYEDGYVVYVDGVRKDYSEYRNALMLIPVSEGDHQIIIKYVPPGLKVGIIISIFSFILLTIIYFYNRQREISRKNA